MPSRRSTHGDFVRANFAKIWPAHLSGFTDLLIELRRRFDGDLDLALVLAVIAARTEHDRWKPRVAGLDRLVVSDDGNPDRLKINLQSISDFSGIPRETVRRKVAILQKKGWVIRGKTGSLAVTRDAGADLEDATGETIAYLASLAMVFEAAKAARN